MREFAPESEFVEPSRSFVLESVACAYCNEVRDVDLLRDPTMLSHPWRCPNCRHSISPAPIEARLIGQVRQRLVHAQTQDLQCAKCGAIKASNTRLVCSKCSGPFKCTASADTALAQLRTLLVVAQVHELASLEEQVRWALAHAGHKA